MEEKNIFSYFSEQSEPGDLCIVDLIGWVGADSIPKEPGVKQPLIPGDVGNL